MDTQLLCTFSNQKVIRKTIDTIVDTYDVVYNKIFILKDTDDDFELMCTYNINKAVDYTQLPNTISLHRKKNTNTLYTINALNHLIQLLNNGVLDTTYQLDWENYRNSILLTNDDGIRRINTEIHDITYIKVKK